MKRQRSNEYLWNKIKFMLLTKNVNMKKQHFACLHLNERGKTA